MPRGIRTEDQRWLRPFETLLDRLRPLVNSTCVPTVTGQAELTTQQAADVLGVSLPFFVALLDAGKIPFRMAGTDRLVRAADLLAYKESDAAYRRSVADELTADAEKHGLGY